VISKEKMDQAVRQVVDNCLHAKKGEKAVLLTDIETKAIGLAIAERLRQVTGDVKIFVMEDFGPRPEDGSSPLKFPDEIGRAFADADVGCLAAQGKKNEYTSFRVPLLAVITANKRLRYAHMISIKEPLMKQGMLADYAEIKKISKKVYDIVSKARKIRVTTSRGTDMTAELDPSWKWINCDGSIKPGFWANLPDGEVFTCPKTINGMAVIDGVLGDYLDVLVEKNPLTLVLKDGRVTEVSCRDKEIEKEIKNYISKCENADRVGEFAIGTNIGVKSLIGNMLQDEKFPGVHIAVGGTFPEETLADWDSDVHMDMVITKTTIEVDGRVIMKDGKFQL